jgi:hypothetical protein
MELWLGPLHHGSAFVSREELRQAWLRHRDKVMATWAKHGKRPAGWWEFESPFPRPFEHEASALYEADLLGEQERAELVSRWRREFERAFEPTFFYCSGPDHILRGLKARGAHWKWADIPLSLLQKWRSQRRCRSKAIRELKETAAEHPESEPAA